MRKGMMRTKMQYFLFIVKRLTYTRRDIIEDFTRISWNKAKWISFQTWNTSK